LQPAVALGLTLLTGLMQSAEPCSSQACPGEVAESGARGAAPHALCHRGLPHATGELLPRDR